MARTKKKQTLFNPNTTAVVFDGEGRIVGGGERVEVDQVDAAGQEAVDNGLLVLETDDGPVREDADDEVVAFERKDVSRQEAPAAKASGASAPKKTT